MKIISPYDIAEVKTRLRHRMKMEEGPVGFCSISILLPTELRGNIKGNTFWLQYTRPRWTNLPQRCFYGTLSQEGNSTVIEGKFKINPSLKGVFLVELCALLIFCLGMQLPLVLPLLFIAISSLTPFLSSICYEKEEAEVIAYLNKLA